MENKAKERRKMYIFKMDFRRPFIIKFCAFIALGGVIAAALIYAFSRPTPTTTDYILPNVILSTTIISVVIGVETLLLILFVSHKIAGPVSRMEINIKKFGEGNLSVNFATRKDDEFRLLAANLNQMAVNIRNKMSEVKGLAGEIKSDEVNEQAKAKLHRLKEKLGEFTV
jgi:methyl-accepting chemotaxis protein